MTDIFPFAFESSLAFYLTVYVLTWLLHVVFMTYVLAGSCYLAWAALMPGQDDDPRTLQPLAKILREWMPFALSAAITAGVAPLLFVQVIYKQEFYTANLLLGWRWLVVVPVLIVAFYLLYVVKSKVIRRWSFAARCALAIGIAGSFLFVAFCWTTNHLLQIDSGRWPKVYETGRLIPDVVTVCSRLLMWVCGAFSVLAITAGWQLLYFRRRPGWQNAACDSEVKRLTLMALSGLILAALFAVSYVSLLNDAVRNQLMGSTGRIWLLFVIAGIVLQVPGWVFQFRSRCFCGRRMIMVSIGGALMLLGTAFLREIVRMESVDVAQVTANTVAAAKVGGFTTFLLFTVVNIGAIVFCLRLINPALAAGPPADDDSPAVDADS